MHELFVTEEILKIALKHAELNGASRVVGIGLKIGELSDLVEEWLQRYFDYLSRDTIAAGARIRVEKTPIVFRCDTCGECFPARLGEIKDITCKTCGPGKMVLASGREFTVRQIEVI